MSKILVTENQLNRIKKFITESENDNTYRREVKVKVWGYGAKYNGFEIDDISDLKTNVIFDIDQEHRSWGIKDISLYNIRGENQIEVEVGYYPSDSEDSVYETVVLNLNWESLETNKQEGQGVVTVGNTLEIDLMNDENGNLVVKSMSLDVYSL